MERIPWEGEFTLRSDPWARVGLSVHEVETVVPGPLIDGCSSYLLDLNDTNSLLINCWYTNHRLWNKKGRDVSYVLQQQPIIEDPVEAFK